MESVDQFDSFLPTMIGPDVLTVSDRTFAIKFKEIVVTNIFVGNLSYDATDSDLREAFGRFGHVASVQVITDRNSGKPRGFGFVRMPNLDDADEAIARMNGQDLCGRRVSVSEANNDRSDDRAPQRESDVPNIFELI